MPPSGQPRRIGKTPDRHFRAEDELYDPARAKAEREGRSLSWVIRHALRLFLDDRLPLPGKAEPGDRESGNSESPSPPPRETGSQDAGLLGKDLLRPRAPPADHHPGSTRPCKVTMSV